MVRNTKKIFFFSFFGSNFLFCLLFNSVVYDILPPPTEEWRKRKILSPLLGKVSWPIFLVSFTEWTFRRSFGENFPVSLEKEVFPPSSEIKKKVFPKTSFSCFYEQRSLSSNIFRHSLHCLTESLRGAQILKIFFSFLFFDKIFYYVYSSTLLSTIFSLHLQRSGGKGKSFPPYLAKFPGQLQNFAEMRGARELNLTLAVPESIEIWTEQKSPKVTSFLCSSIPSPPFNLLRGKFYT